MRYASSWRSREPGSPGVIDVIRRHAHPLNGTQKTLWLALLALVVIVASLRWFGGDAGSAPGIGKGAAPPRGYWC